MNEAGWNQEKILKAYFTVEAALVLPLTLGILVVVMYLMFYQYDRCLLEQDTGISALRASILASEDGSDKLEELRKQAGQTYWDKYVAFEPEEITGKIKGNKLEASRKGSVRVPFLDISKWTGSDRWGVEVSFINRKISPVLFIRVCRRAQYMDQCKPEQQNK